MKKFTFYLLLMFGCSLILSSCSKTKDDKNSPKTFVLVHGSWQGAFAWKYVKQQLEAEGQKVVVIELPGHGDDYTPPELNTLYLYRDKLIETISALNEKVILVAHSMGGMVVTAAAEKIPQRIRKLIYIGAFLPANGQSLIELISQDTDSRLGPSLVFSPDGLTADIPSDVLVPIFCADGSDEVKSLIVRKYRTEPTIPTTQKLSLSAAAFGSVEKYYLHTLQDLVISPKLQYQMVAASNITKTYSINSSHCPFLSRPDSVTKILMEIAFN